ncbi:MAG: FAD-dependent oxidoreductase [Candidatus Hydrogenedentes bacterium]|nr:FAD-dependent oxidoreductase [Candidatus Hydrogenedentota bacterium]
MSKHKSVWLDTGAPLAPPSSNVTTADTIVVGAGATGLLTAVELQRRGQRILLVDPRAPGSGTTGHTTGKVTSQHGVVYQDLVGSGGEAQARRYGQANEWAVGAIAELVAEAAIDCDFTRETAYLFTEREEGLATLEAELQAAQSAGIAATLQDAPLHFLQHPALGFPNQARLHAGRFVSGLLALFLERGGAFRQERAIALDADSGGVRIETGAARLEAGASVVATLYPFDDHVLFAPRMVPKQHHGTAFRVRTPPIQGMYLGVDDPTFSLRWTEADGGLLIAVGKSHRVGEVDEDPYAALGAYVRQRFDVVEERYRWSAHDQHTPDKIPYIGRYSVKGFPMFTATGFRAWGLTHAMVASRLLSDLIEGRENPWQDLYDPLRIKPVSTAATVAKQAVSTLKHLVFERLRTSDTIENLAVGEAATVREEGHQVGAYRDPSGVVHLVSLNCTHLGCVLAWDPYDHTWSCPCHGSRFDHTGAVLYGPATQGIGISPTT